MTSELRPAVETRAEVLDQLLSELQDGNAWDSTISLLADYADLVQDLLKDREAVRAYWYRQGKDDGWQYREDQAAELAKFKALAETLAGALENALRCTPQAKHGAVFYDCGDPWEILTEALREYKEARDD